MSHKIWIIGLAILLTLSSGYVYFKKPEVLKSISNLVIEAPQPEIKMIKAKTAAIYLIADGTGSTYQEYAIPQIDTVFISNILDITYERGGGYLWLSYISRNSRKNQVLYFNVPTPLLKIIEPERNSGETFYEYDKKQKIYSADTSNFTEDSLRYINNYLSAKEAFLKLCCKLLNRIYIKNSPDNQWSDIIGSLNAAFYTMRTIQSSSVNKYLVCFSDLQEDMPNVKKIPKLQDIQNDVKILVVNPIPGSSHMVTKKVTVIENPERVLEYISQNYR
jgi:hypothetical protein